MNLFLCSLGAYFVAQLGKTVYPWTMKPWVKLVLALMGALGVSAALDHRHLGRMVVFALAGAGLAILLHRAARVLTLLGDGLITGIMRNYGRR